MISLGAAFICFCMSAINIPFIIQDPTRYWNWMSAVICFGLGIISAYSR